MPLNDTILAQLRELGIDTEVTIEDPDPPPESNDITWERQAKYLDTILKEEEKTALAYLLAPDRYRRNGEMMGMEPQRIEAVLESGARFLDSIIESKWPRRDE